MSKDLNTGNVISFGKNNWYVIDVDSEKNEALLLSCNSVDEMAFHETLNFDKEAENFGCYWHNSSIRKWLNEDYYQVAFNDDEKDIIVESETANPQYEDKKRDLFLPEEETTTDRVFLLNIHEAMKYLPGKDFTNCHEHWWIRNPTINRDKSVFVLGNGEYYFYGSRVDHKDIGVRPAIRIRTDSVYFINSVKVHDRRSIYGRNLIINPINDIAETLELDNLLYSTVVIMAKGPTETDVIDKYAESLLNSGCSSFVFTGEYAVCWKRRFFSMNDKLNLPGSKQAVFVVNKTCGVLEELVHGNHQIHIFVDSLDFVLK